MRPAVYVGLNRCLDDRRGNIAGRIGHRIELEHRHALHHGLLDGEPAGIPFTHIERRRLVGLLQDRIDIAKARVPPEPVIVVTRLGDQVRRLLIFLSPRFSR